MHPIRAFGRHYRPIWQNGLSGTFIYPQWARSNQLNLPAALPVHGEVHRLPHGRGAEGHQLEQHSVRLATVIFPPRHFASVTGQVDAADVVVLAEFGAAQPGEEAFRHVGAGFVQAVGFTVVDAVHGELANQPVPGLGFVGVNRGALGDAGLDEIRSVGFVLEHVGDGAPVTLADRHHHAALAVLVLGKAAVLAVLLLVGRLDVATDIAAVDFHLFPFATHDDAAHLGRHGFPELVAEDEGRLVLDVQIAAHLKGADALGRVDEEDDGRQVIADRQLVIREQGTAGRGEVLPAVAATITRATVPGSAVAGERATVRANRLAFGAGPTNAAEHVPSLGILHAQHRAERNAPGGCGKEEVLGHRVHRSR